ncbi:MAG: SDR family NAD(P)-dependent oxidoreductase [Thermoleophilia bacterium]|nr:SDR family NAD(P)-dependent oxidoreductase [Thermoleophilia bacterium]
MSWSTDDIPNLDGRTALVTGANGGLGLETARALAAKGAKVLMAARNQEKAAAAEVEIRAESPDADLEVVPLDLGSLESVRAAADQVLDSHERIDILVNNAGLMAMPERRTADGFEMQFGVNHLGHWALTARLMPAILAAPSARVVSVTSTAHHMGRAVNPSNPHLEGNYGPWKSYGQSKLANFHFGIGLQRRFERAGVSAASLIAHPGLSNTDLQAHAASENSDDRLARFFHGMAARSGMEPAQGALSQLRAAAASDARGGEFYGPLWVNSGPPVRKPIVRRIGMSGAIAKLWDVSERETGETIEVGSDQTGGAA